jgi:hypothetical protein
VITFHLGALVAFGLGVALDLARFTDGPWFVGMGRSWVGRRIGAMASTIAPTTGVVALVTLASSAALGYHPSLQFLQLLSALDIAWATAGLIFGVRLMANDWWAFLAGLILAVICIWSIWRYLDVVGFTVDGGWLLSGPDLWRYVLPFDMAAAVMAVGALAVGLRMTVPKEHARKMDGPAFRIEPGPTPGQEPPQLIVELSFELVAPIRLSRTHQGPGGSSRLLRRTLAPPG